MAKLTDTLPEQQWMPQAIGGARQTSLFGDTVDGLNNVLKGVGNAQNSSKKGTSADDDPVLDEYAMKVFQDQTGIQLGDPGYDQIVFAKRMQKAKDNGTISATTYDIRMQGNVADLMRQHPDKAREIMADAYNLHGIKDNLFREAAWANKQADAVIDNQLAARKKLLDDATAAGLYDPRFDTEEVGIAEGVRFNKAKTEAELLKAATEAAYKRWEIGDKQADATIKDLQGQMGRKLIATANETFNSAFRTAGNLMGAAADEATRKELLQGQFTNMKLGIRSLYMNAKGTMATFERSYKDPNGTTRTISFDDAAKQELETWYTRSTEMVDTLANMQPAEQERFIKNFNNEAKISAMKQMPTLIGLNEGLFGGSWQQTMDVITNGAEKYGIDTQTLQGLTQSLADGIDNYTKSSFQAIADKTAGGAFPSSSYDQEVASKAFNQNVSISKMFGKILTKSSFSGPGEAQNAVKQWDDAFEDVLMAVRKNYTPNNIDSTKAAQALGSVFNNDTIASIEAFGKQGGAPETQKMYYQQSAIAASTFLEGLRMRYMDELDFNQATGRFVGKERTYNTGTYGGEFAIPGTFTGTSAQGTQAAAQANALLDYIENVHAKNPVINEELLKGSKQSLRSLLGTSEGLEGAIKTAADKAKAELAKGSQSAFEQAVGQMTNFETGRMGGIDTNPFDNFDDSVTGDGAFNSSYSGQYSLTTKPPEELEPIFSAAAEEFGIDPGLLAAVAKQESAFNAKAKGPSIPKYKGTPDEHALGIMQLLPSTAKDMGVDVNDPKDNIRGGAKYLREQLDRFNGDAVVALMAYNWGPSNVEAWLKAGGKPERIPAQTADYVKRILGVDVTDAN